jgi:hypothetical protein
MVLAESLLFPHTWPWLHEVEIDHLLQWYNIIEKGVSVSIIAWKNIRKAFPHICSSPEMNHLLPDAVFKGFGVQNSAFWNRRALRIFAFSKFFDLSSEN